MTIARQTYWLAACAAIVLAGLAFEIDGYPLLDPDEGRNAEIAREMAATNDYVLPRLNSLPYLDKPVLYFAAGALAMEVLGPSVLAARLPSLIFTLATLALVAWFAAHLYGRDGAWTATIAAAATPFTLAYARTVILDSALTCFVTAALVGFYMAVEGRKGGQAVGRSGGPDISLPDRPPDRRGGAGSGGGPPGAEPAGMAGTARGGGDGRAAWWRALAWSAIGLGVLTKGPIALGLPLMVAIPYAIWRRRGRALADPVAVLLFAAIVLPWAYAISREVPGFLRYALLTETARRLTTSELGRTGPIWYFLLILPAAALPWSVVALTAWRSGGQAVRRSGDRERSSLATFRRSIVPPFRRPDGSSDTRIVFLLLWIFVPLLFFTLSQSKRPQYVLPLIPAVGLLVAAVWHDAGGRFPGIRPAAVFLGAVGLFFILGRNAIPGLVPASTAVAAAIPKTAMALGVVCLFSAAVAFAAAGRREIALIGLGLPVAAIPFASRDLMDAIGADRSAVEVARALDDVAGAETQVIAVQAFPLSLPFYLRRTLIVSTADGSELTSNYLVRRFRTWAHRPDSPLRSRDWWREALTECDHPRVFVVRADDTAARDLLSEQVALLVETRKHAAYGPCGISDLASSPAVTPNRPPSS